VLNVKVSSYEYTLAHQHTQTKQRNKVY